MKQGSTAKPPSDGRWGEGGGLYLLVWILLASWLFIGCLDLAYHSWNVPWELEEQVEEYLFHLSRLSLPMGILPLYIPYFVGVFLVSRKKGRFALIITAGLLARLALLPSAPILETDIYRYLWDGRMTVTGNNPYRYTPEEIETLLEIADAERDIPQPLDQIAEANRDDELHREILSHINNKEVPTLYLPTAQYAFAVADLLVSSVLPNREKGGGADWELQADKAQVIWKAVLLPFELGTLFLIISLLKKFRRDQSWVVVYAWSPLVLKEYGNTGHYDPIVVFLVLLGLRLLIPAKGEASGEGSIKESKALRLGAGGVLGAAAATKLFPILFFPILWRRLRWFGAAAAGAAVVILYVPFLGIGHRLFTGFATYSDRWEFNSGLVAFFEWFIIQLQETWAILAGGIPNKETGAGPLFSWAGVEFNLDAFFAAKFLCAVGMLGVLTFIARRVWTSRKSGLEADLELVGSIYLMTGVVLLASPVTDPWYVCWIVPYLCFFPNMAWLYLTFSQQVYYLYFWNDWNYVRFADLPISGLDWNWEIGRPLEYIPFFVLLAWGWWRNRKRRRGDWRG